MALVSKTIPGLHNGVSQQPTSLRLESQCEIQENALSTLVDGLIKRPPTEWVTLLDSRAAKESFIHTINRDIHERYIVIVSDNQDDPIEIFTLDGDPCTVLYECEETKEYLTTNGNSEGIVPRDDLKAVTIADHTLIVNRTFEAQMSDQIDDTGPKMHTALVTIKLGVASCTYKVTVSMNDSVVATASHTTADPDSQNTPYKTTEIAEDLYNQLVDELDVPNSPWWDVRLVGSTVIIERQEEAGDFSIKVSDSHGNQAMTGIKRSVQKFTDLPVEAEDGLVLEVSGDDATGFGSFYVKYVSNEEGAGIWRETVKPYLRNHIDPYTMPLRLVRTGHNEFTVQTVPWEPRLVGDENSSPEPSFIGNTINDIFFYKNRLGFLSGENVILSRAGDYFNLWPGTVTDVLDGDPIDEAVATSRVAILRHAVPFTDSLMLFSDQQQFSLTASGGLLAPRTVTIDTATNFETSPKCTPVGAGPNLYFVVPNGDYAAIREYFVQPNTQVNDAADVTAHVPRYLPNDISVLVVSTARDLLFALAPSDPTTLYVYKYYWDGDQKAQSSWSKWLFDDEILNIAVIDDLLYMVVQKDGDTSLLRMNLENIVSPGLDYRVHLDKQFVATGVFNPDTHETVWTLPYSDSSNTFTVVRGDNGFVIGNVEKQGNTLKAFGDFSDTPCFIGKNYTKRYRFSRWFLKDQQGVATTQGRLQIRTLTIAFTNTGYFQVLVTPPKRPAMTHDMTGTVIGDAELGKPAIITGEKRFFIMSNSTSDIDLINDTHLPSTIQSAGFEGFWTMRSRVV